jgi:ABC-2 type transport system permease protein
MSALTAQAASELRLTARRGDSLLLIIGIPLLLLVFFSFADVLPTGTAVPVDFLGPGVLALAVMGTAMVQTAIGTGFERQYLVLKRIGTTPLGRGRFLAAKLLSTAAVIGVQLVVLGGAAMTIGWDPTWTGIALAVVAIVLAIAAFGGIGMLMAGTLPGMTTLAAANGLYIVLLLVGGMVVNLDELPTAVASVARLLPSAALSDLLHGTIGVGESPRAQSWIVLAVWAIVAPAAAVRWFRWD